MKFKTLVMAHKMDLIPLTVWLTITDENKIYVLKVYNQVLLDPKRKCELVKHKSKIAVFVNDVTK